MPRLPERKVGLIACSGEDLPEGTVSRQAALLVLERLRPGATVTLCLPLFLGGEERERAFARFFRHGAGNRDAALVATIA